MGVGRGTNTKAELLALWGLLCFQCKKDLISYSLQVLGDSSAIINWAAGKSHLHVLHLDQRCNRVMELKKYFSSLSFIHSYREFNQETDSLSKMAVGNMDGFIFYEVSVNGLVADRGSSSIY